MTPVRVRLTAEERVIAGEEPEPIQQTPGAGLRNKLDKMEKAIRESRKLHAQEAKEKQEKEEADRIEAEKQVKQSAWHSSSKQIDANGIDRSRAKKLNNIHISIPAA